MSPCCHSCGIWPESHTFLSKGSKMLAMVCVQVLNISGGRLSRPLALFNIKCLIAIFISFPMEAPEGIFVVSCVFCVVIMHICWGGAARLFFKNILAIWSVGPMELRAIVRLHL